MWQVRDIFYGSSVPDVFKTHGPADMTVVDTTFPEAPSEDRGSVNCLLSATGTKESKLDSVFGASDLRPVVFCLPHHRPCQDLPGPAPDTAYPALTVLCIPEFRTQTSAPCVVRLQFPGYTEAGRSVQ